MNSILEQFKKYGVSYYQGVIYISKPIKVYDFARLKREIKRKRIEEDIEDIIVEGK